MVITINQAEAWVGGKLSINTPLANGIISGSTIFEGKMEGTSVVNNLHLYGKAVDTNTASFILLGENNNCYHWNNHSSCNIMINTTALEDSSVWQFYMTAENASDSSDLIKSITITDVIINNTLPSLKIPSYLTPNKDERIKSYDVKFGAFVNSKTTNFCIITFTSNNNPGKKTYKTNYEQDQYCNLTIIDIAEGNYEWTMTPSDGLDFGQPSSPQRFSVDISSYPQQDQQNNQQPKSTNWFTENWIWIAAVGIIILFFGRRKRRR